MSKKTYTMNQKWNVIYVEDAETTQTTGLYRPYNIHFARPFYI
jgi:hypothetical protein